MLDVRLSWSHCRDCLLLAFIVSFISTKTFFLWFLVMTWNQNSNRIQFSISNRTSTCSHFFHHLSLSMSIFHLSFLCLFHEIFFDDNSKKQIEFRENQKQNLFYVLPLRSPVYAIQEVSWIRSWRFGKFVFECAFDIPSGKSISQSKVCFHLSLIR